MKVRCLYNNPFNLLPAIPDNFDYGLEVNKQYLVMGMMTFKQSDNLYFLVDENSRPGWFPYQIFDMKSNKLPSDWFVKINEGNDYVDYQNLIGFDELCNDEDFF